jgi:hypothetical protein
VPGRRWTLALCGATFLIWTTRIGNIWGDETLDTGEKRASTALALSFTLLAAVTLVAWWRRAGWLRTAVGVLAAWTIGVWAVRMIGIAGSDRGVAFVVVHAVLAIVSVLLAVQAVREQREPVAAAVS